MIRFYMYHFDGEESKAKLLKKGNKTLYFNTKDEALNYIINNYDDKVELYVMKYKKDNEKPIDGTPIMYVYKDEETGEIVY